MAYYIGFSVAPADGHDFLNSNFLSVPHNEVSLVLLFGCFLIRGPILLSYIPGIRKNAYRAKYGTMQNGLTAGGSTHG